MLPLNTSQPARRAPIMTALLILANVLMFAVWQQSVGVARAVRMAALVPAQLVAHTPGAFQQIWLSMFMHASWMHLIGNMWFLWIFGCNIEDVCGRFRYLCFYLVCGLLALAAYVAGSPGSTLPYVGASGAISGVLGGYLLKFPASKVRAAFLLIFDVPAWFFLLVWIGVQVGSQLTTHVVHEERGGVAYLAHVGGFIAGMLLITLYQEAPGPAVRHVRAEEG